MRGVLSIGKLGAGRAAAEYYLARQAGCPAEYYTGSGERRGVWLGRGAAALGLSGDINEESLRHLLPGRSPDGATGLVEPVLRADPRGRLPGGPLAAHVRHLAAQRDIPVGQLLDGEAGDALGRVLQADTRAHQAGGPPRATVRADVAATICRSLGLDPRGVYSRQPGAFDAALVYAGERVDVRVAGFDVTLSAPKWSASYTVSSTRWSPRRSVRLTSADSSPTSTASFPTVRSCRCAACATAARPPLGLRPLPRQS
jgi:hypothetical protein